MENRTQMMVQLRQEGWSYGAIANNFGLSRQRVFQLIGKRNIAHFRKITEKQCIFKGLREYMNKTALSLTELIRRICGEHKYHPETSARYRAYLCGKNDIPMRVINEILRVTGLTYEQAFLEE